MTSFNELYPSFIPVELHGRTVDFSECILRMDDDIREDLSNDYADSLTNQEFLDAYIERHAAIFEEEFAI